ARATWWPRPRPMRKATASSASSVRRSSAPYRGARSQTSRANIGVRAQRAACIRLMGLLDWVQVIRAGVPRWGGSMLDGNRYFAEFPDEDPAGPSRIPLSPALLTALAAVEREISTFIRSEPHPAGDGSGFDCKRADR